MDGHRRGINYIPISLEVVWSLEMSLDQVCAESCHGLGSRLSAQQTHALVHEQQQINEHCLQEPKAVGSGDRAASKGYSASP